MKKIIIIVSISIGIFLVLFNYQPKIEIAIIVAVLIGIAMYCMIDIYDNNQQSHYKNSKNLVGKLDIILASVQSNNESTNKLIEISKNIVDIITHNSEIIIAKSSENTEIITQVGDKIEKLKNTCHSIRESVNSTISQISEMQNQNNKELAAKLNDIFVIAQKNNESTNRLAKISINVVDIMTNYGEKSITKITETENIIKPFGDKIDNMTNCFYGIGDDVDKKIDTISDRVANSLQQSSEEWFNALTEKIKNIIDKTKGVIEKIDDGFDSVNDKFEQISQNFKKVADAIETLQKADDEEKQIIKMLEKLK